MTRPMLAGTTRYLRARKGNVCFCFYCFFAKGNINFYDHPETSHKVSKQRRASHRLVPRGIAHDERLLPRATVRRLVTATTVEVVSLVFFLLHDILHLETTKQGEDILSAVLRLTANVIF